MALKIDRYQIFCNPSLSPWERARERAKPQI